MTNTNGTAAGVADGSSRWRAAQSRRRAAHAESVARREVITVEVASETDPTRKYRLHAQNGVATCNCRGYLSHSHCKHATALEAVLKEKQ